MESADSQTKAFKSTEPAIHQFTRQTPKTQTKTPCYRCGRGSHSPSECKFREATCHQCKKKGHIAPVCRSKTRQQPLTPQTRSTGGHKQKHRRAHHVHEEVSPSASDTDASSGDEYHLHKLDERSSRPIAVKVLVNERPLTMELDTGAAVSIISEETRKALLPDVKLRKSALVLKTYTAEPMEVTGQLNVKVEYGSQREKLVLIVVKGGGPSLFGRNWLKYLRLDWSTIAPIHAVRVKTLNALLNEHQPLFAEELGKVEPYRVTLQVQPDVTPRFFKPRPVPFAIRDAVGKELDRLEREGIIEKVSYSDWAAPIVPVPKKDGRFRICGDYKVTINQALSVEQYPLPKPEDLFATLAGGQAFSKLDLSQAYLQVQLDEQTKPYLTVNTHQGLYRYTRLPFGVASAPALFQKMMDTVLQGIPGVICYIDDILITGNDAESHLQSLKEVLMRLEKHGFRLKRDKCEFLLPTVEYLGHQVSKDGIKPLPSKVAAINQAPTPRNIQELRSFLGLLNYYGKFIPNLSTLLHPLNALLQNDHPWKWSEKCSKAFRLAKEHLTSAQLLTHYDPSWQQMHQPMG